jgi:arylsulfatase A-like enzyme
MKRTLPLITALLLAPLAALHAADAPKPMPNIVVILADDLGWRDLSCFGSTFYETPNIDRLARRGIRFTEAYAANPTCSPTRGSIMTGLYPARLGITLPVCHENPARLQATLQTEAPANRKLLAAESCNRLLPEYYTLAEALRDEGYATALFGKWHLGPEPYDPLHQGFQTDIPHFNSGMPSPKGGYLPPWGFKNFEGKPGEHLEDRLTSEAIAFLGKNRSHPFFVCYAAPSVHSQWQAKPELLERWQAKADPKNRQHNPIMGAMMQTLDDNIGRLMRALDDLGLSQNTIVIFFSDNGGVMYAKAGDAIVTDNHPLRAGKGTIYEGGTRVPCIVAWPGTTGADTRSDAVISSIDFYPTILDMLGLKPRPDQKFDGISIVPALRGQPLPRKAIFCHYPEYFRWGGRTEGMLPSCYVRAGDWKLIRFFHDNPDQTDRFELYNLREDIGEKMNLAGKMPEKVEELNRMMDGFLKDTQALLPKPNPAYLAGANAAPQPSGTSESSSKSKRR